MLSVVFLAIEDHFYSVGSLLVTWRQDGAAAVSAGRITARGPSNGLVHGPSECRDGLLSLPVNGYR